MLMLCRIKICRIGCAFIYVAMYKKAYAFSMYQGKEPCLMLLEGIKVVDLTHFIAGPYCTMLLADLGADVLKVESPEGDYLRKLRPAFPGGDGVYFMAVNYNKKSVVVDLSSQEGQEVLYKMVSKADVFVHNLRPTVVQAWGVDYDKLVQVNPYLVYCAITGFGQEGPYRDRPGFDLVFQAMSGMMSIIGEPDSPPMRVPVPIGDMVSGIYAALGISGALFMREKIHQPQKIEVSMLDALFALQSPVWSYYFFAGRDPEKIGNNSYVSFNGCFRTSDGRYIVLSVPSDKFWRKLCRILGAEELLADERFATNDRRIENGVVLTELMGGIFKQKKEKEWRSLFENEDLPWGLVYSYSEALSDPQLEENQVVAEVVHKAAGKIKRINSPIRISNVKKADSQAPPILGQNTEQVLREFGFTDLEIASFISTWSACTRKTYVS